MKFILPKLRLGQTVEATVVDCNLDHSLIVDFDGDLLRVLNHAGTPLTLGQKVTLEVKALNPLQFRIQEKKNAHIDKQV